MPEQPRDYDREFKDPVSHRARQRLGLDIERGDVQRFVVQLEYERDEWEPVVRYDHDPDSEHGHDDGDVFAEGDGDVTAGGLFDDEGGGLL